MLTTIALLAALLQPAPQPAPLAGPALILAPPSWAFAPMSTPDSNEPEWIGAEFAEFVDFERAEALMASVSPFASEDAAEPFEAGR